MDTLHLETAKSYYVLAQIFAVIAGFFIVAAGLTFSSPSEILNTADKSVSLCERILNFENMTFVPENITFESCMNEFQGFFDFIVEGYKTSYFLICIGFVFIISSIGLWVIGRLKLAYDDFPDVIFLMGLFVIELIFITLAYIKMGT